MVLKLIPERRDALMNYYHDMNRDNKNMDMPWVIRTDCTNASQIVHDAISATISGNVLLTEVISLDGSGTTKYLTFHEIIRYANDVYPISKCFWLTEQYETMNDNELRNMYRNMKLLYKHGYNFAQYADCHEVYVLFRRLMALLHDNSKYTYVSQKCPLYDIIRFIQRQCISNWNNMLTNNDRLLISRICDMLNNYASIDEIAYYFETHTTNFGYVMFIRSYEYENFANAIAHIRNISQTRIEISRIENEISRLHTMLQH